jgi:NADP-dependent 3-hydroxy acid dehydrogenase YdfG
MADGMDREIQGVSPQFDDPWRLDGRVAIVTGASTGLGARFAHVLHEAGASVVATARRADLLDDLAKECGDGMETVAGDLTDPDHRLRVIKRAESIGRLDVLVNNAGICNDGPLEEQSLEDLVRTVRCSS